MTYYNLSWPLISSTYYKNYCWTYYQHLSCHPISHILPLPPNQKMAPSPFHNSLDPIQPFINYSHYVRSKILSILPFDCLIILNVQLATCLSCSTVLRLLKPHPAWNIKISYILDMSFLQPYKVMSCGSFFLLCRQTKHPEGNLARSRGVNFITKLQNIKTEY